MVVVDHFKIVLRIRSDHRRVGMALNDQESASRVQVCCEILVSVLILRRERSTDVLDVTITPCDFRLCGARFVFPHCIRCKRVLVAHFLAVATKAVSDCVLP